MEKKCIDCEESVAMQILKANEADKERAERSAKRMYWIALIELIIIFAMLFGIVFFVKTTNITVRDIQQNAENGTASYVGGDYNGLAENKGD